MKTSLMPWYQQIVVAAGKALAGLLFVGAVLDALSNAINLITLSVTYAGSIILVLLLVPLQIQLKRRPLPWTTSGGHQIRISKLGATPVLFIIGAILLLWFPRLTKSGTVQSSPKDVNPTPVEQKKRSGDLILIVFDPTILPDDPPAFEQLVQEFRQAFLSIPGESTVALFIVDRGSRTRRPAYVSHFDFDLQPRHQDALAGSFIRVDSITRKAWNVSRGSDAQGRSCLLSTLYATGEFAQAFSPRKPPRKHLLIVSDMVEVCSERGMNTDLSSGRRRLFQSRGLALPSLDLSGLQSVVINRVPYRDLTSPSDVAELDFFWKSIFARFRVDPSVIHFGAMLPSPLPWAVGSN